MAHSKRSAKEIVNNQRQMVVNKVMESMKKEGLRWSSPFLPHLDPQNPVSGTIYKGINRVHLAYVGLDRGYEDNRWCTFSNIMNSGWHLKKGAKAAIIEHWKEFPLKGENEETGEEEIIGSSLRLVGYWNVFNASEIDGIPPADIPTHTQDDTVGIAENLVRSSRCPIWEKAQYHDLAAYSSARDVIYIASRTLFRSDESFTRTLLHEMTHATGHATALDRTASTKFGTPAYAEEELVAELGSLFLSADLGIQSADMEGSYYENHVSYLQSWLHALEDDPSYLFKAASKADKAASYIMDRYKECLEKADLVPVLEKVSLKEESLAMTDAAHVQKVLGHASVLEETL